MSSTEKVRIWRKNNPEKTRIIRARWKLKRYGITFKQKDEILRRQNGLCAICKRKLAKCIDHDHATGRIRGILCNRCNLGLGFFEDNSDMLELAIKYLKKWVKIIDASDASAKRGINRTGKTPA